MMKTTGIRRTIMTPSSQKQSMNERVVDWRMTCE